MRAEYQMGTSECVSHCSLEKLTGGGGGGGGNGGGGWAGRREMTIKGKGGAPRASIHTLSLVMSRQPPWGEVNPLPRRMTSPAWRHAVHCPRPYFTQHSPLVSFPPGIRLRATASTAVPPHVEIRSYFLIRLFLPL